MSEGPTGRLPADPARLEEEADQLIAATPRLAFLLHADRIGRSSRIRIRVHDGLRDGPLLNQTGSFGAQMDLNVAWLREALATRSADGFKTRPMSCSGRPPFSWRLVVSEPEFTDEDPRG
jgi:hypothetical protein